MQKILSRKLEKRRKGKGFHLDMLLFLLTQMITLAIANTQNENINHKKVLCSLFNNGSKYIWNFTI